MWNYSLYNSYRQIRKKIINLNMKHKLNSVNMLTMNQQIIITLTPWMLWSSISIGAWIVWMQSIGINMTTLICSILKIVAVWKLNFSELFLRPYVGLRKRSCYMVCKFLVCWHGRSNEMLESSSIILLKFFSRGSGYWTSC